MNDHASPRVSVFMTTYFHEKYIRQSLDSILMQKTDFDYEICISDDCSEDDTCKIIKEYQEKYPFIRLNENKENIGLTANFFKVKCMCQGKYIVDLSGDDYYIDPYKLQKQADFLEKNPEYLAVATAIENRYDNETTAVSLFPEKEKCNRDVTLEDFLKNVHIPLNGLMMRNVYLDEEKREFFSLMPKMSKYIDDLTDELLIHLSGKVYILSDPTTAYRLRRKTEGEHNFGSLNKGMSFFKKHVELFNNLAEYFKDLDFFERYREMIANGYLTAIRYHGLNEFHEIYSTIPESYRNRHLFGKSLLLVPSIVMNRLSVRLHG